MVSTLHLIDGGIPSGSREELSVGQHVVTVLDVLGQTTVVVEQADQGVADDVAGGRSGRLAVVGVPAAETIGAMGRAGLTGHADPVAAGNM